MDVSNENNVTREEIVPTISNLSTHNTQLGNLTSTNTEKIRWVLIWVASLLATLGFIAFLITRDFGILVGDSLFVFPILAVYRFYFPKGRPNQ